MENEEEAMDEVYMESVWIPSREVEHALYKSAVTGALLLIAENACRRNDCDECPKRTADYARAIQILPGSRTGVVRFRVSDERDDHDHPVIEMRISSRSELYRPSAARLGQMVSNIEKRPPSWLRVIYDDEVGK